MITNVVENKPVPSETSYLDGSKLNTNVRLGSIDFMRGFTVAAMILVNSPGSWNYVYPWLCHASWNGCTFADLVFPFFLFIVGVSIVFSLDSHKGTLDNRLVVRKILIRGAKLFALGLALNFFSNFDIVQIRIPGVLQRIALVFVVCALIFLKTSWKEQLAIFFFILIGYTIVLLTIPHPVSGKISLDLGNNIAAWVDNLLLKGHMWQVTKVWDPEGILSTFPAIASGLSGVLCGVLLKSSYDKETKFKWLLIAAFTFSVVGLVFNIIFPINKSLWSSSFVFFTTGVALLFFGLIYFVLDMKHYTKYSFPFKVFGTNAIVAYLVSEILTMIAYKIPMASGISLKEWLFNQTSKLPISLFNASFIMAILWVSICYIPVWVLYKKRIFIKV